MATSPRKWYQLSTVFALTTLLYTNMVSCSQSDMPSYRDHCASIVPESTSIAPEVTTIPFPPNQDGYYLGGDEMLKHAYSSRHYYRSNYRKILLFRTHHVYSTKADGVYKVEASLLFQPSRIIQSFSDSSLVISTWSDRGALSFDIQGFWSKSSGKLCMVGSTASNSGEGKLQGLSVLIKLNSVESSSSITSLVTGTLESLSSADDSSYFQPISFLMFPLMNYTYTEVSKEVDHGCSGEVDDTATAQNSLSLPLSVSICSVFGHRTNSFKLDYASSCNSSKSCNLFSNGFEYLPQVMSITSIQCSADKPSLRLLLEFPNSTSFRHYNSFNPNTSLVAEASWNAKKNQLCVVACRISSSNNYYSFDTSQVEDCSVRLSLRFPAVWSIGNTSSIVGDFWSTKTVENPGYFDKIKFYSYDSDRIEIPGLKYKYTVVDKARKSCPKQTSRSEGKQYPTGIASYEMSFYMSVKSSKGRRFGWGNAYPISMDDKIAERNVFYRWSGLQPENSKNETKLKAMNISYQISLTSYNASSMEYKNEQISAEGTYDGETGVMCMVGCKYQTSANESMDCEILVHVEFSAINSKDYIEGRIESTREKSSPLYFESLSFSAVPYYSHKESIWRMDMEIIMALISNTLVCIFVGYQILHMKKNPSVFPYISLVMLAVLTLGRTIPLMLNFEALFLSKQNTQRLLLEGWLEMHEVIVRGVTMVAFLLQFRLLQLVWSARLADKNQKASWIAEKKALYVSLPLYIAGGLIALFLNWKINNKFSDGMGSTSFYGHQDSVLVDLRSYAGLVLDCFLFPQIIFNIFLNSTENALSSFFYMGTTLVRLIPHAYDLYRKHYYFDDLDWSYMYADKVADYFSTAWDVIIPLGGLFLAATIYLQQRNGGRCFLPKKFKELEVYEKLSMADNA